MTYWVLFFINRVYLLLTLRTWWRSSVAWTSYRGLSTGSWGTSPAGPASSASPKRPSTPSAASASPLSSQVSHCSITTYVLCCLYAVGCNDFDVDNYISRAIERGGLWKSRIFRPWKGNERSKCHLGPKSRFKFLKKFPRDSVSPRIVSVSSHLNLKRIWSSQN